MYVIGNECRVFVKKITLNGPILNGLLCFNRNTKAVICNANTGKLNKRLGLAF